jgi:NAD(P)-dependent dehydrogenase (short-subunit alcohol dehydrogenase family)
MPRAEPNPPGTSRVALVTGAARGNGFAIAEALGAAGHLVYLADLARDLPEIPYPLASPADVDASLRKLREQGIAAHSLTFDVRDEAAVERAVRRIEQEQGRLDVLVNNAGVLALNPIERVSVAEWSAQMDVIAKGTFLCCRAVLPGMNRRGWGRIVNIASVAGHRGLGTASAYTAAKHAVIGLTRALAMEAARQGVTVNAVCPGTVPTPLVQETGRILGLSPEEAVTLLSQRHLSGQPVQPADVAAAVLWLASDSAARVNGTSLFVDDGWSCH